MVHDIFNSIYKSPQVPVKLDEPDSISNVHVYSFLPFLYLIYDSKMFTMSSQSQNIFEKLPTLAAPNVTDLQDDLDQYLSLNREDVKDVIKWWFERQNSYPQLSKMALDYHFIPSA